MSVLPITQYSTQGSDLLRAISPILGFGTFFLPILRCTKGFEVPDAALTTKGLARLHPALPYKHEVEEKRPNKTNEITTEDHLKPPPPLHHYSSYISIHLYTSLVITYALLARRPQP